MRTRRLALIVLFAVFGTLLAPSSVDPAGADGTPDLLLAKTVPSEALLGDDFPVVLSLSNPSGPSGYNVTFIETVPAGVSYVGGSAPTEPAVLAQGDGSTVLVWENVADILVGATVDFGFSLTTGSGFGPGDSVITSSGAYAHFDPRRVADIDPVTGVATGDFSGSDTTSRSTTMRAFQITRAEPSAESELLRGVHAHQTVMTLSVSNNFFNPTSDVSIIDYLPADLEFLGCGGVDNSSGEEYVGSGVINPGNEPALSNPCVAPSGISTVNLDPDGLGPASTGVYTRLTWDAATLATTIPAGGSFDMDYLTAIPLQANAQTAVSDPTANLDNNGGAATTETENVVESYVVATGTYTGDGSSSTATHYHELVAEDLSIHKSVDSPTFEQGATPTFTLEIESSEYALSTGSITVTDTLPATLDFTGSTPAAASSTIQPDGSTLLTWTLPAYTAPSSSTTITINTAARTTYRNGDGSDGAPIFSNDQHTNVADVSADVTVMTSGAGATATIPLGDTSSADQTTVGPTISKEVSVPVGGLLTCGDGTGVTFSSATASSYRPGDRVCFRLNIDFPSALDTQSPTITDLLPDGFSLESWTSGAGSGVDASAMSFTDNQPLLSWELADQDAGGIHVEIVLSTIVDSADAAQDGDLLDNLMKLRYPNTAGDVFQNRSSVLTEWSEASLDLAKGVTLVNGGAVAGAPADTVTVEEGDVVTFQVDVTNSGSAPALDAEVRDVLPVDISCGKIASISDAGVCDAVNGWIDWPAGADLDVGPGTTTSLTYEMTIPAGTSAGASLTNRAGVRRYTGETNTGTPFVYVPTANIDPTLTSPNTTAADDDSEVVTSLPTIAKIVTTSVAEVGNNAGEEATIGETLSYTIDVTIPDAISYFNASIVDVLTAGEDLIESSVSATLDGGALPAGFTLDADDATNTVTVTFPPSYVVADGADQALQIQLDSVVLDAAVNTRGHTSTNTAELRFEDASATLRTVSDDVDIEIVEPNISVRKDSDDADGKVVAGQTVTFTVDVENPATGRVSVAHGTVLVDTVPDELIVLEAPADPAEDGDTIAPDGGVWDAAARTITWTVGSLDPADSITYTYSTQIGDPLIASGTLRNSAEATTSSLSGTPAVERDHTSPNGNVDGLGYQDSDEASLVVPTYDIEKSVSSLTATVGEALTYTLTIDIPEAVVGHDVTVIDDLPTGLVFESVESVSCDQGGSSCSPDITSVVDIEGAGDVAFFLGDLVTSASADRVVTIDYLTVVDDVAQADDGSTLLNTATLHWNGTDTIAGTPATIPDPASFSDASGPWTVAISTDEPTLEIDKDVVGQNADDDTLRAKPGDTLSYTIDVRNVGSSAAYDATVTDVASDDSWAFSDTTSAAGITNIDADPVGGLAWTVDGPIPPGGSVTLSYDLVVSTTLGPADEVVLGTEAANTADVSPYHGVAGAIRAANPGRPYRSYDDVTPDTVDIEIDLAQIGDRVWFDIDGDGVEDTGEPGLGGIDVTVTHFGTDGAPGGGDDEVVTATTDSDGLFLATRLPAGTYLVEVDESDPDFPAGLVATYDLDGTTTSPNGAWTGTLLENDEKLDVDFGYTGTGSIGDTVWFDQNRDGVIDGSEGLLAGVDLTVRWLGPDGVDGGGDDVDFVDTTDGSGNYLVDRLPAGAFSVTVDTATLPAGYVNVADPGGENDNRSLLTLGDGATDLDQDFGYAGTDIIGDLVWLDQNDDGVRDVGEPGLGGIILQLTYFGPDGVSGGSDDAVFTTTTDGVGFYEFRDLPPGEFELEVTGGVPANAPNTYDPDTAGLGDSRSSITLPGGTADLDQDFGFGASSVLGDRVWWDLDGDGIQDLGEPGLNDVEITATYLGPDGTLGTSDDQVFVTTTGGDGDYLFRDINDGDYVVTVTDGVPIGFDPVYDGDSGTISPDESIDLSLVTNDLGADFGYSGTASIGDLVWFDADRSGTDDATEFGLPDVAVSLTWAGPDDTLATADDIVLSTVSDASGGYQFSGLPQGSFETSIDPSTLPPGLDAAFDPDTGTTAPDGRAIVVLSIGETVDDHDHGFAGSSAIGDLVWFDRNADGTVDADDVGLGGVDVEVVWAAPWGPETFTATTDADGLYSVLNLPSGSMTVTVVGGTLPGGMSATHDRDGGFDASSAETIGTAETVTDHDFGFRGNASLGDLVWLDLDGDGVEGTEPGVAAQDIDLIWQSPMGPVTWSTTTDSAGGYSFDGLAEGPYTVTVVGGVTSMASNTADPDGGGDSTADLVITGSNDDLDQDFGYQGDNSIGDLVWTDDDRNGSFDGSEAPIPRVTVTASWAGPDGVLATADDVALPDRTTDGAGLYGHTGLPDGTYAIAVGSGLPPGVDLPSFDADDATTNPDGATTLRNLGVGDPAPVADDDQDFGFSGRGQLGGTIWLSLDGDDAQDPDEPGIADVAVTLVGAGIDGALGTADDIEWPPVSTDASGGYLFEHLPPGPFEVRYEPSDLPDGTRPQSDVDGGDETITTISLGPAEQRLDIDFAAAGTSTVEGTVYVDAEGDGNRGTQDDTLAGVTVTVRWNGPSGPVDFARTTDSDGFWQVDELPAGEYLVVLNLATVPDGLVPNDPVVQELDVGPGETVVASNALVVASQIGDVVWHDDDRSGLVDEGEVGVEAVRVNLSNAEGDVIATTLTETDGSYLFDDLSPGEYTVEIVDESIPADMSIVSSPDTDSAGQPTNVAAVELDPGTAHLTADFGLDDEDADAAAALAFTGRTIGDLLLVAGLLLWLGMMLTEWARPRRKLIERLEISADGRGIVR